MLEDIGLKMYLQNVQASTEKLNTVSRICSMKVTLELTQDVGVGVF